VKRQIPLRLLTPLLLSELVDVPHKREVLAAHHTHAKSSSRITLIAQQVGQTRKMIGSVKSPKDLASGEYWRSASAGHVVALAWGDAGHAVDGDDVGEQLCPLGRGWPISR
jgi:hypothetical protein